MFTIFAQMDIKDIHLKAEYTHCRNDVSNLTIARACKNSSIQWFMTFWQKQEIFRGITWKKAVFEPLIEFCKKQLGVTKREIKNLNGLSKTRSVERYQAYDTIYLLHSYRSLFIYLFYFLLSIQVSPQLWIQFNGNLT